MTDGIDAAIRGFRDIILGGIPVLLQRNETAFLSFLCAVAAVDALAAYCYTTDKVGVRFADFVKACSAGGRYGAGCRACEAPRRERGQNSPAVEARTEGVGKQTTSCSAHHAN
jgi:hypothetical protein